MANVPSDNEEMDEQETPQTDDEGQEEQIEKGSDGSVKVSEEFQRKATSLVDGVRTLPELNFLSDLVNEQRNALAKAQKKESKPSFSTEGMPELG